MNDIVKEHGKLCEKIAKDGTLFDTRYEKCLYFFKAGAESRDDAFECLRTANDVLRANMETMQPENDKLRKALEEITKKEGRYSMNPLEHAGNCIEDMSLIAEQALKDK